MIVKLKLNCKYCDCQVGIIQDNGPHKELICNACKKHLKFLSKKESTLYKSQDSNSNFKKEINFLQTMIDNCITDISAQVKNLSILKKQLDNLNELM